MKKQLANDEITRMIERENVITFKRKLDVKGQAKSQKQQEDDVSSAKSHPIEDPALSKPSKKSIPLPQLSKQKKRLILRNILPETKSQSNSNYLQKEVRQHDNLMLKNLNNSLTNENIKLKTKNMNLEKQINRLQKIIEEDPQKHKLIPNKEIKARTTDSTSLRIALKNMQKELEEVKKENSKIKTSIKFTTIAEVQVQRDSILEETIRLREMLEEQRNKLMFLKANQHGMSAMEQKLTQLQERNHYLARENNSLKGKSAKNDERDRANSKTSDNQKNLNKMLFNARRLLKQKERQLQILKAELKRLPSKAQSSRLLEVPSENENSRSRQVKSQFNNKAEKTDKLKNIKEKRLMSKSAQKYRGYAQNQDKCQEECTNCKKVKEENVRLQKDIEKLKADLDRARIQKSPIGELSKNPIIVPTQDEIEKLQRFLCHRFKAHHLNLEEATYHLISYEGKPQEMQKQVLVSQLLEIAMAEPFSIISDRYIEAFIVYIGYNELIKTPPGDGKCVISDDKKLTRKAIQDNFKQLVGSYELINQRREEEMFIQIAELVTQYQQHILKALNDKRNTESTIPQKEFYEFFKEIQLEKDYIDFMVSQIILESLDLDHLNIYNLFEIFYMPPQEQVSVDPMKMYGVQPPHKKKYNVIESVVKEEDEEYEESKSFMESRQKTQSKHEQEPEALREENVDEQEQDKALLVENVGNDGYEQQNFEEQKMQNPVEQQQKRNEESSQKQAVPQHYNIEQFEEQYIQDYES